MTSRAYISGAVSQRLVNLMQRLNRVFPAPRLGRHLPLRLLRPLDRPLTRLSGRPLPVHRGGGGSDLMAAPRRCDGLPPPGAARTGAGTRHAPAPARARPRARRDRHLRLLGADARGLPRERRGQRARARPGRPRRHRGPVMVTMLAAFLFSMGAARSLSYFIARRPEDGPTLLTTWVLMLLPLTALAIAITELLLPTIFANGRRAGDRHRPLVRVHDRARRGARARLRAAARHGGLLLLQRAALRAAGPDRIGSPSSGGLDALTVESALIASTAATALALVVVLGRALRGSAWAVRRRLGSARSGTASAGRARRWPPTSPPGSTWPCCRPS